MLRPTRHRFLFEKLPRSLPLRKSPPDIPEDVYSCIFDHIIQPRTLWCGSELCLFHTSEGDKVEYRDVLSKLTLVCRFFAIIFMPIFLDTISISISHSSSLSPKTWILDRNQRRPPGSFARALVRNNQLARARMLHVKECRLHSHRNIQVRFCLEEANLLLAVTGKMPHTIQSLSLKNVCVTDEFFTALGALTSLTSLVFSRVIFPPRLAFPQNVQLRLESFALFGIRPSPLVIMEPLCHFVCLTQRLRVLHTDDDTFLEVFMKQPRVPHLEVLEVALSASNSRFVSILLSNLSRVPFLHTLCVRTWLYRFQTKVSTALDPSLLPNLQHLHCPTSLVSSLIPNRPLKTVDLTCDYNDLTVAQSDYGCGIFHLIQQSTAAIEVLHIPAYVYVASADLFGDTFPRLVELGLTLGLTFPFAKNEINDKFKTNIYAICHAHRISALPITQLSLEYQSRLSECRWAYNLRSQAKMITLLHSTFSAVLCIEFCTNFGKGWTWRRQCNSHGCVWKPSIGRVGQETIQSALKQRPWWYPTPEMDVDSTFASLFSPK